MTDGLGGIFGVKHSEAANAPRVLVASHMDEVGFMVSDIKPDGTFRVVEIGGWNPMVVSSQRFKLLTRDGREIPVISGSVPPHLTRGKGGPTMPAIADIVFDGGKIYLADDSKVDDSTRGDVEILHEYHLEMFDFDKKAEIIKFQTT